MLTLRWPPRPTRSCRAAASRRHHYCWRLDWWCSRRRTWRDSSTMGIPGGRRRIAVVLLAVAVAFVVIVVIVTLPGLSWWPGWAAVGRWWAQWWPAAAAALAGSAGVVLWRSVTSTPALEPGAPAAPSPPATAVTGRHTWDWSKVTSVITAFTALAALVFTGESLNATRSQDTLAEQGQITDRYTAAVDQIGIQGADHLETRLGGVYALGRLMTGSPRDQPTIVE